MKKRIKFGIVALVVILAIGVAAAVFITFSNRQSLPEGQTAEEESFTVTFLGPDESLLYVDKVKKGAAAQAPANPNVLQGYVFAYWDSDFSCVTEDMTVHAICQEIGDAENVFSCSGAYARQGEQVTVPLQLCGNVCLCAFSAQIKYDVQALDFVEFTAQDGAVDANCIEEDGVIYLNFVSYENTTGEVDLVDLVFTAVGEVGQTPVSIEVTEVVAYDDDYEFYIPAYTTVPAVVTIAGN